MDDWPEYKQKIIELARKESVSWPFIKKLLLGLEDESFTQKVCTSLHVFNLNFSTSILKYMILAKTCPLQTRTLNCFAIISSDFSLI